MTPLYERAAGALARARTGEAWGPTPGAAPEPEPTALAALALDDDDARAWLRGAQRGDGSFGVIAGSVESDAATGLAALALASGPARELALDHIESHPALPVAADPIVPHDPDLPGWGWTLEAGGWVEPTSRALLALRRLRPGAGASIEKAIGYLADRECVGGGWNYGNRRVYGEDLPPFGQATAVALVALHGSARAGRLVDRGVDALRRLWPVERGPLTMATTLAAFRLLQLDDASEVERALDASVDVSGLDVIAAAWIALASGPGLAELAVGS